MGHRRWRLTQWERTSAETPTVVRRLQPSMQRGILPGTHPARGEGVGHPHALGTRSRRAGRRGQFGCATFGQRLETVAVTFRSAVEGLQIEDLGETRAFILYARHRGREKKRDDWGNAPGDWHSNSAACPDSPAGSICGMWPTLSGSGSSAGPFIAGRRSRSTM